MTVGMIVFLAITVTVAIVWFKKGALDKSPTQVIRDNLIITDPSFRDYDDQIP